MGENKLWVVGIAEDGSNKDYIVTLTRSRFYHADAALSALTLSSGLTPAFDPATTHYASAVLNATTQVTVTATANDDPNATVAYNSADADAATGHQVDLEEGENIIVATVTDRDGMASREYVMRVWRQPEATSFVQSKTSMNVANGILPGGASNLSNKFTTGPSQQGYIINASTFDLSILTLPDRWGVAIHRDSDNSVVGEFDVSGVNTHGRHTLPAFGPIHLEPNTDYRFMVWKGNGNLNLTAYSGVTSGVADSALAPGWSIEAAYCTGSGRACSSTTSGTKLDFEFHGSEVDDTAPVLSNPIIQGNKITLTYDDLLDEGSVPATSAFAVRVRFVDVTVNNVAVSGREVVLTLASSATETDFGVMNYTVPGSNPIRNTGHHAAGAQINLGFGHVSPTRLKSLTVGGVMVPGFDPRETVEEGHAYTFDLPYERRGSIAVTATAQHGDSYTTMLTNGNSRNGGHREPVTAYERLEIGPNEVEVRVYAGCCSAEQLAEWETYTLTINRAAPPDRFGPLNDALPVKGPGYAVPVNTDSCWYQREDGRDRMRCTYLYKHADRANTRNIAVEVEVIGSTDSAIRGYRVLRTHYPLNPGVSYKWPSYDTPERDAMLEGAYVIREVPNTGTWTYFLDRDVEHGYCYLYAIQAVGGTEASPTYGPGYHWVDPASVSNQPRYHTERPPRCIPHYTGSDAPSDAPSAPQNLAATPGEAGIALTWDASAGADSYRVLRSNQDDALYAEIATATTNSYTDTTAVVAQGYAYKVQARNDSGDSELSDHVLAMIIPPAPDAPTGFEADVGDASVTLSWDASDDDTITGYQVIRQVRDADPPQTVLLRRKEGETTQVTDSSPEAGAAYTYSVMAINAGGRSEAATVDVDIPAASSDLAAPTDLAATVSDGTVVLGWDAVEDATGYNVLRQGPGETEHTQLAAPTTNAYTDTAVAGGSSYSYQVQAVDDDGAGSLTEAVTADIPAPPDAPTNVQATATVSSVTLTWTAPGETLSGYFVYRKVRNADPPEEFAFHNVAAAEATSYTDATVESETAYAYYVVAARSALELSAPSATVEVDTPAASPFTGFTLVDASDQSVLASLTDGASVELSDASGGSYGVRANLADGQSAGSVKLELTGAKSVTRTENTAPYSLYGDSYEGDESDLHGQSLPAGSYTLTATAYSESAAGGDELGSLEVSFTVTQANRAPAFGSATYSFSIAEDAATGANVGALSATDADNDGITYSIEAGNGDGKFAIDGSTGAITTAGALDHETTPSYTLTVQADDGEGGTDTATVNVTVTEVDEPSTNPLTGFTLVDASDQSVLASLTSGASVALADPNGGSYGIRANVDSTASVGSVRLVLSGAKTVTRTESAAPYSLYGDSYEGAASDLYGESLPAGSYTLTATAYSERAGGGDELGALEVSFTITAGN